MDAEVRPMPERIARLRAEIAAEPATIGRQVRDQLLYQALDGLAGADVRDLGAVVDTLVDDPDPVLRRTGLRLLHDGVRSGALLPGRASGQLGRLLRPGDGQVLVGALRELAEPWAVLEPVPADRLRPFLAGDPVVSAAAVGAAVQHGHAGLVWDAVTDERLAPRTRQRALADLGTIAARDRIPEVLALAVADPLLFAEPAIAFMLALHRRGIFPDDKATVSTVVDLAMTVQSVPVDDVATILFIVRRRASHLLSYRGDASRRLALLAAFARQAPDDSGGGSIAASLLREAKAGSRERVEALDALRELRYELAEDDVLDALVDLPGPALRTLEAIGGRRTVEVLAADPPYLAPVRRQALELLWHLTDDPAERRALVARLNPHDLPARIAVDLGAPDPLELAVLRLGFDADRPVDALVRLARTGDAGTVPAITDLLARIVAELAAASTVDSAEPAVPPEVVAAVRDLGGRLHHRKRIRPVCLLDAVDAVDAGNALLAGLVLDVLDRDDRPEREQPILLALLGQAAGHHRSRGRLRRLLWHRDRHVRKHAIALLAQDLDSARALSASFGVLAQGDDAPTVRQAVIALGAAGARWAAPVIAGRLDHPLMNVKKAAADALVTAGTPAEVPALLGWLGRHDNPGLRGSIRAALRAILGDAYAATVLAAAERATDERTRDLLLTALAGSLTAAAVHALAEHRSPLAPTALAMLADNRLQLGTGDVADLADRFRAYGITPPTSEPSPESRLIADVATLVERGWQAGPGARVVDAFERSRMSFTGDRSVRLRRLLPGFLALAAQRPAALALAVHIGRAPWPADETGVYVEAVRTLIDGLPTITRDDRDAALRWLETVVPHLPEPERAGAVDRIRALPATGFGRRSVLPVLRAAGAILTRADLDRALDAAESGPDPWEVEPAVLRQAFDTTADEDDPLPSRRRLASLIRAYPGAVGRAALVDEMIALQPLGAPQWTIGERATAPRARGADRDGPRTTALRVRLLADLDAPAPADRLAAARTLLTWPEPRVRRPVLDAYLAGRLDGVELHPLATALSTMDLDGLAPDAYERAARVVSHVTQDERHRIVPHLLRWWEATGSPAVWSELRRADPDVVAAAVQDRLDAGAWGALELLRGRRVIATPALVRALHRIRESGDTGLADAVTLVDGPLRGPDALGANLAALAALRAPAPPAAAPPTRADLLATVRTGEPAPARQALARLAEIDEDRSATGEAADPELAALLGELMRHPQRRMRLLAHRTSRRLLDRDTYLRHTAELLTDPQPEIVRTALRAVSHAGYLPAVRAAVDLLEHPDALVRKAADAALIHYGLSAASALTHAMARARPDRRQRYAAVLDRIATTYRGSDT